MTAWTVTRTNRVVKERKRGERIRSAVIFHTHSTRQHNTTRWDVHCSVREQAVVNAFVCLDAGDGVSSWDDRGRIRGVWL